MKKQKKIILLMALIIWAFSPGYGDVKKEIKFFTQDREISETEFLKSGETGIKVTYMNGVKISEIEFKSGQKHGKWLEWYVGGQKKCEREYRYDKENGSWMIWEKSGRKKSETNYLGGLKHGLYIEWHPNGQKINEGKYLKGDKDGRWLKWEKNGNLLFEESWKHGRLMLIKDLVHHTERLMIYYPSGQKKYERGYKRKMKHGKWSKWDVYGSKRYEREYKDGMKHGKWIEWDKNGNITGEEIWEKGELIKKIK